jgi:hypothetical protein
MEATDTLDAIPPAPVEETDEQKRQRLARLPDGQARLPLPNAIPPAPAGAAQPQTEPPKAIMPAAPVQPVQPPANANAGPSAVPTVPAPSTFMRPGSFGEPAKAPEAQPKTIPAAPVGPAQKRLQDLTAQGAPELHGGKKIADIVASLFPLGRAIETNIPGSPQNYTERMNQAEERAGKEEELAGGRLGQAKTQQELEAGARNTPQARQKYMNENKDQFSDLTPFETADYILNGKMPTKEPELGKTTEEATLHDLMTGGENGQPRINPDTKKPYTYLEAFAAENQAKQAAKPDKNDKKIDEFVDTNNKRVNVMQRPDGTTYNATRGNVRMEAGVGAPGDVRDIAQGIIGGQDPPDLTKYGYRDRTALAAEMKRQGFNLTKATEDWQATQKYLATLNGTQQVRLRQALGFTKDSLAQLEQIYDDWQKVGATAGWKAFNKASLATAKQLPGKAGSLATNLEAQIADLTSELGTVYKGGNSSTDESLKLAAQNLGGDWNEQTFKDALARVRESLRYRENSINSGQAAGTTGNPYSPAPGAAPTGGSHFAEWDKANPEKK